MPNPPKSVSYLKKLVSAARAIVTYQVGLPVGCRRVRGALFSLRPHIELSYPVFDEYLKSLSGLPGATFHVYAVAEGFTNQFTVTYPPAYEKK